MEKYALHRTLMPQFLTANVIADMAKHLRLSYDLYLADFDRWVTSEHIHKILVSSLKPKFLLFLPIIVHTKARTLFKRRASCYQRTTWYNPFY